MKDDPVKGDWIHLVQSDMRDIDLNMSDDFIATISREEFKKIVKEKGRKLVYNDLEQIKQRHIRALASIRTDLSLTALNKLLLPGLKTFLD